MAAQSKTTAVHFSLIFFVMLSVILGVVAYLFYADFREQSISLSKAQTDLAAREAANKRYLEEIEAMKRKIGAEVPEVGVVNPGDASVLGQADAAITAYGTSPAVPTLVAALQDLRTELDKRVVEIGERQSTIDRLNQDLAALRTQYQATAQKHDEARQKTEQDLAGEQTKFGEQVAAKDRELAGLRQQLNGVQIELEQTKEQLSAEVKRLNDEMEQYRQINIRLNDEVTKIRGDSFEVADGVIRTVDQVARTVTVNLGDKDGLKKGTSFSVYRKNNIGIGRDAPDGGRAEDIKASIEVTRILGPKLAEARILSDTSSEPIAPGDPIYTPLWSAGRVEEFAFVGKLDIDGDANYTGDRERLHEIVESAGAVIGSEVTDTGERVGRPISAQTRFLVLGHVPDLGDVADPDEREQVKNMMNHRTEMQNEARMNGVRMVNLNQFLDYIGFVPQRRLFVPGANAEWRLEAGSRSGGVDARPNSGGTSTGSTSALFGTRRSANPQSGGNTSQVFGGRRTGTGY